MDIDLLILLLDFWSSSNTWQRVGLVILLHAFQVYSMNSKHYKKQIPFNWISIIRYFQFQFTFLFVRPTERLHNRPQEVDQDLPYRCILDPLPVPWNTFCLFLIFYPLPVPFIAFCLFLTFWQWQCPLSSFLI